jgi:hypothetical protein
MTERSALSVKMLTQGILHGPIIVESATSRSNLIDIDLLQFRRLPFFSGLKVG